MCVSLWIGKGKYAQAQLQQQSVKSEDIIRSKRGKKKSSCSVSGVNFTGHFQSSLRSESPGESLSVRGRGGITGPTLHRIHHAPPYIKHFFFADWLHNQIPSEWAGVGWVRGEQKVGPLPLDNAIISAPLARNAKFHSLLLLSVRQSKLREGPRRPLGPPPAPCDPIQPLIPQEPDHTRSVRTSSLQLGPSSNF